MCANREVWRMRTSNRWCAGAEHSHHKALRMRAPATNNKYWRFERIATRWDVVNLIVLPPIVEFGHETRGLVKVTFSSRYPRLPSPRLPSPPDISGRENHCACYQNISETKRPFQVFPVHRGPCENIQQQVRIFWPLRIFKMWTAYCPFSQSNRPYCWQIFKRPCTSFQFATCSSAISCCGQISTVWTSTAKMNC